MQLQIPKGSASLRHAVANVSNRYTTACQTLALERGMKLEGRMGAASSRPIWVQWIWELALKKSLNNNKNHNNFEIT